MQAWGQRQVRQVLQRTKLAQEQRQKLSQTEVQNPTFSTSPQEDQEFKVIPAQVSLKSTTAEHIGDKSYLMFLWLREQIPSKLLVMADVTPKGFKCHTSGFGPTSSLHSLAPYLLSPWIHQTLNLQSLQQCLLIIMVSTLYSVSVSWDFPLSPEACWCV